MRRKDDWRGRGLRCMIGRRGPRGGRWLISFSIDVVGADTLMIEVMVADWLVKERSTLLAY